MAERSTLLTSPLSLGDFVFRLLFFTLAPFAIVVAAELFPVRGALVDVGLALFLFVIGEAARRWARRSRPVAWVLSNALAFETYYRERPPRTFAYYVFYPLLFPYWIASREARREFLVFRGYTLGGSLVLLVSLVWQYFAYWAPGLSLRQFLPAVLVTLGIETLLVLSLLMPIATTVVWYHSSLRRGRLFILLAAGLLSTTVALARVARRRDPVVSYATRDRVSLRTAADPGRAHDALLEAARAAWGASAKIPGIEGDGKVSGEALERAEDALERFYKHDEAHAFDLWASPRKHPQVLVVYFEARRGRDPIWAAMRADASEIVANEDLPDGAFRAMRHASDGTAALLSWPKSLRFWSR